MTYSRDPGVHALEHMTALDRVIRGNTDSTLICPFVN